MAIVGTEKQAKDIALWHEMERRAREVAGETPVTLIVDDIKFVNHEIRIGQYFFADIVNEGVLLFNSRHLQLAKPKALNAHERLALAEVQARKAGSSALRRGAAIESKSARFGSG
jgi:uncharacterized protein